ncbi:hypothetical protein AVDCRST_MAG82-1043, partial [uncultured Rubrobacteraceae bacterium]
MLRLNDYAPTVGGRPTHARGSASVGLLPQPAHGRRAMFEDRDVPFVRAQPQFGRGAAAREPLAVRGGYDPIPTAMQEKGRSYD